MYTYIIDLKNKISKYLNSISLRKRKKKRKNNNWPNDRSKRSWGKKKKKKNWIFQMKGLAIFRLGW